MEEMVGTVQLEDARADWEQRIGQRTAADLAGEGERLPPPTGVTLERGAGLVTLRWQPVAGAMGYLVHRADLPEGPFDPIVHGGQDVLAVPGPVYADATGQPGREYWYAVASIRSPEQAAGPLSASFTGASLAS
jgi:xylan 1,4-beta-xylosidase